VGVDLGWLGVDLGGWMIDVSDEWVVAVHDELNQTAIVPCWFAHTHSRRA